ncbi:DUF4124 domain-containing protein [Arsukibacterium indicum]|uniref:DUF4124 domain-containing protein n=1 Tax=Arsukibacterium indicum TaxID=2848612 RepID=A0ABS6MNS7_9GAMM|nr:DUF4124 domain-containing protein [Arsukibacterium indicum]MBV2129947.1 DUF4124 domain-containing protein [Arsukibacterium indicum]
MKLIVISAVAGVLSFSAMATVYKCEQNGVVTYSQIPCSDDAEETGYTTDGNLSPANQQQPAVQTESPSETLARVRDVLVKRDLQQEITRLKGDKARLQSRRDIEITKLRQSKLKANNNLAGAVWEESVSKEMAAIAAQYDTDIQAVDSEIDRLSKQLRRL